jgi:hypothetical protein
MKALGFVGRVSALCGLLLLANCSEQEVVAALPSLSASEDAVFLCRDEAGVGRPYADCPDRDSADDGNAAKKLSVIALVSQTLTDEVAVVNVTDGNVVDVDPARPGYGFLRVGGRPISMAATPGGRATFVATGDVGRNGIFALPTTCLDAPQPGETERDLTSWPACRLDETPGELSVLVQPFADASPDAMAAERCRVDSYADEGDVDNDRVLDSPLQDNVCQGDLREEGGGEGRRKLIVALPDSGELGVIDAQELLNTPAGTFPPCVFEKRLKLQVDVPAGVAQKLPADLTGNLLDPDATCDEVATPTAPPPSQRSPQPAGFALADDDRLYIADQAAPVVHVVDTSSVCGLAELAPLLPMSLRQPTRVVTTRRVAVSPLTPAGQRFVYAIDAEDQPGASVMVFDVSPGATDRTPLVRSGSPELPNENPDRLQLGYPAKDITFAYRDIPYVDPSTGVAEFGTRCSPDLSVAAGTPAGLARPNSSDSTGARPGLLRGLFGFILLTNGQIAIVDEDDFDADCRRPIGINQSSVPDFRGCANDTLSDELMALTTAKDMPIAPFFTSNGLASGEPLVSNEVSCRVVEPHRFRSSRLAVNDSSGGVRAPSLREAPQLSVPASASNSAFSDRPRLLAVPFAGVSGEAVPAEVFIGATRFSTADTDGDDVVTTDPNDKSSEERQTQQSVVLPPLQPRSYAAEDRVTVTFEGSFAGDRTAGFLRPAEGGGVLTDASMSFCGAGVYDVATMKGYAQRELGVADDAAAEQFAQAHADFVQLTTALPLETDSYWKNAEAKYADCLDAFGAEDAEPLSRTRDFRIDSAFADRLLLSAREPAESSGDWSFIAACFPTAQTYRLRAGKHWVVRSDAFGFRHDVVASGSNNQCVRSCNPLRKWSKGRVFEISSSECRAADEPSSDPLDLRVGCATDEDVACVYDQTRKDDKSTPKSSALKLTDPAAACIFDGLNARFALYRGRLASARDTAFTWQTTGGFTPLLMSLTSLSTVVAPQSIQFLQQPEQMAVVDGASRGLVLFSLDTFSVVKPSPFF